MTSTAPPSRRSAWSWWCRRGTSPSPSRPAGSSPRSLPATRSSSSRHRRRRARRSRCVRRPGRPASPGRARLPPLPRRRRRRAPDRPPRARRDRPHRRVRHGRGLPPSGARHLAVRRDVRQERHRHHTGGRPRPRRRRPRPVGLRPRRAEVLCGEPGHLRRGGGHLGALSPPTRRRDEEPRRRSGHPARGGRRPPHRTTRAVAAASPRRWRAGGDLAARAAPARRVGRPVDPGHPRRRRAEQLVPPDRVLRSGARAHGRARPRRVPSPCRTRPTSG